MVLTGSMFPALFDGSAVFFRFVLGIVFVAASVPKLADLGAFEDAVGNYRILPARAVRSASRALPFLELGGGAALVFGLFVVPVAAVLAVLLILFCGAVALNLIRGRTFDCGCSGGIAPRTIGWPLLASDVALVVTAAVVVVRAPAVLEIGGHLGGRTQTPVTAGEAVALLLAAALSTLAVALVRAAYRVLTKDPSALRMTEEAAR